MLNDGWCNYILSLIFSYLTSHLTRPSCHPFLLSAACDSQCLTCDMAGVCTSCRDPAKVLLFGECQYDSCAHQYYLNTTTQACRGTRHHHDNSAHTLQWYKGDEGKHWINNEDV